jgi:hypothetical protein
MGDVAIGPTLLCLLLTYMSILLYLEAYGIWRPCAVAQAARPQTRPCSQYGSFDIFYAKCNLIS